MQINYLMVQHNWNDLSKTAKNQLATGLMSFSSSLVCVMLGPNSFKTFFPAPESQLTLIQCVRRPSELFVPCTFASYMAIAY